jgi:hypothetical protein
MVRTPIITAGSPTIMDVNIIMTGEAPTNTEIEMMIREAALTIMGIVEDRLKSRLPRGSHFWQSPGARMVCTL